jgi:chromosome segregation ATPase
MAQPAFDDGIEKLEALCTLLGQTSAVVTRDGEILDARGDSLDRTEDEARKRCEQIAERLATALDEVNDLHEDAVDASDRLSEAAHELASARLASAEDSVESARSSFEERLIEERSELEQGFQDLFETGFTSLATAVDEMETELAQAGESARQGFEVLEHGITEVGQQASEDGARTVAALQEAERNVAEDDAELEQQVAVHTDVWTEELPEAVRAECASVAEPLEVLYREWEAEVVAEGDELSEGVASLLEDAADIVAVEAGQPLASAAEAAVDDSLAALSGQQDALTPVLGEGEPASEAAAGLVDDLVVARQLVSEIDRLLNAIAD